MARQGDVLVFKHDNAKGTEGDLTPVPTEGGRVILAHGEATGHAHALPKSHAKLFSAKAFTDRVLVVTKATALLHEEHHRPEIGNVVELPKGTYRVRRQREYSPEAIRNVAD